MAYGLIGTGRSLSGSAQAGLGQAAKLETSRNMMGDQLAQAASGQRKALMGTGAGIGAQYGLTAAAAAQTAAAGATGAAAGGITAGGLAATGAAAGPWGALIGAGIGLLLGELF
jgi:hypothetical protein